MFTSNPYGHVKGGPRVIPVIVTDLELRGRGTEQEPYRRIRQFWSLEGELLAEVDPYVEEAADV